jgi:hypothetical protein
MRVHMSGVILVTSNQMVYASASPASSGPYCCQLPLTFATHVTQVDCTRTTAQSTCENPGKVDVRKATSSAAILYWDASKWCVVEMERCKRGSGTPQMVPIWQSQSKYASACRCCFRTVLLAAAPHIGHALHT